MVCVYGSSTSQRDVDRFQLGFVACVQGSCTQRADAIILHFCLDDSN
ncbi:Protein of unknown function [Pyronema omphalodes CBS 100304]|uniref:Uncharacterized protein n=1 Tax=Pyronema omphalodes (strain CBS 100304) TaxID=1076935 RepID=U4KWM5_PYROM|nr:Protein of unknown function [Pyronema omphalodes CBS 100304]